MDRSIKLKLFGDSFTVDSIGQYVRTNVETEVYGNVQSVSRDEFYAAGKNGFKPELVVDIYSFEYSGQLRAQVDSVDYQIYRTYQRKDERIELYLAKEEAK